MKQKDENKRTDFVSIKLAESKSSKREKLIEIYKKDRNKARVIFENESSGLFVESSIYVYEYDNKDFRVVHFTNNLSFSKNNIIYRRDKTDYIIIYKHATKSFYLKINGHFKPLTVLTFKNYCYHSDVQKYLLSKFGWIRNALELDLTHHITLTTILKKKLFNREKLIKHIFGVNHNVAKVLTEVSVEAHHIRYLWKKYNHLFYNLDKLTPEFLRNHLLQDTCKFAQSFNEKINCAWGEKRFKQFHDELYKKHIDVILEFEPLSLLNVAEVYLDFAKYSGYKILISNHDLIAEGKKQSHCVGTYSPQVNSGTCAIFSIGAYTLDLRFSIPWDRNKELKDKILHIAQFRGYSNCDAPKELYAEVQEYIDEFNKDVKKYELMSHRFISVPNNLDLFIAEQGDLPF